MSFCFSTALAPDPKRGRKYENLKLFDYGSGRSRNHGLNLVLFVSVLDIERLRVQLLNVATKEHCVICFHT